MATVTAPNRTIVAVIFLVGGALQILGAIVGLINAGNSSGFYLLSNLAIGVGFILFFAWHARATMERVAYIVAAVGWLLLALTSLINLGIVGQFAVLVAIIGSVFAGIIVLLRRPFGAQADILFFVAMMVGAVNLLLSENGNVPGIVKAVVVIFFGALLIMAALRMLGKRIAPTA